MFSCQMTVIKSSQWFLQYSPCILVPKDLQTLTEVHPAKRFSWNISLACYIMGLKDACCKDEHKKPRQTPLPQTLATECCIREEVLWCVKLLSKLLSYSEVGLIESPDVSMTQLPNIAWSWMVLSSDKLICRELPPQKSPQLYRAE